MFIFNQSPLNIYKYQEKLLTCIHHTGQSFKLSLRNPAFYIKLLKQFDKMFVCSNNGKSSKEKTYKTV